MKLKRFIKEIKSFFKNNRDESELLKESLEKLNLKKEKILKKLDDSEDESEKIKMIEDLERKIEKRLSKIS